MVAVIIETLFDNNSRASAIIQSHTWQVLGFTGGSGGIGLYMKRLNHMEQHNITVQQMMDNLERLPNSKQKEKLILDCVKLMVNQGAKISAAKS